MGTPLTQGYLGFCHVVCSECSQDTNSKQSNYHLLSTSVCQALCHSLYVDYLVGPS